MGGHEDTSSKDGRGGPLRRVRTFVLAENAGTASEILQFDVEVREDEFTAGEHYSRATAMALNAGYKDARPFDETEPAGQRVLQEESDPNEQENGVRERFEVLADKQGWSDPTRLMLVLDFISRRRLGSMLLAYANQVASSEDKPRSGV